MQMSTYATWRRSRLSSRLVWNNDITPAIWCLAIASMNFWLVSQTALSNDRQVSSRCQVSISKVVEVNFHGINSVAFLSHWIRTPSFMLFHYLVQSNSPVMPRQNHPPLPGSCGRPAERAPFRGLRCVQMVAPGKSRVVAHDCTSQATERSGAHFQAEKGGCSNIPSYAVHPICVHLYRGMSRRSVDHQFQRQNPFLSSSHSTN